ncbi:MAG TPA: hypothetical protein PLJ60_14980 [Chryseolinea sp.]|nr:hypothetical protein [Chryseolinea sp.]HPH47330.1 hypothetical protein [Chryseolinea sp.]HPM31637.1 hypothetical protein [Chryseolinea sp.]
MLKEIEIKPTTVNNKTCLQFDFPDYLDSETASAAIEIWKLEMKRLKDSGVKINLIFNCDCMTGFDTEARRKWQMEMKEQKNSIADVWVICNNIFILGAAKTMGLLSGYSIKTSRSISEIK